QVAGVALVLGVDAAELLVPAADVRRHQAEQAELAPLLLAEGAALVEHRRLDQQRAAQRHLEDVLARALIHRQAKVHHGAVPGVASCCGPLEARVLSGWPGLRYSEAPAPHPVPGLPKTPAPATPTSSQSMNGPRANKPIVPHRGGPSACR